MVCPSLETPGHPVVTDIPSLSLKDICPENLIAANRHHASVHKTAVENNLYIIDFDSSRQFKLGPGVQRAITLRETQTQPPNGLKHFDPYSWDVYCTGCTLELIINVRYCLYPNALSHRYRPFLRTDTGERRQRRIRSYKATSAGS